MAERHTPTTLVDWLDDLTVRFLLNLPASELSSVPRICFQVEEAQWFYEDFVRPAVAASGAPPLPSLHLRQFSLALFQHCPLTSGFTDDQHIQAYEEFLAYKVRVPVRGAILLDHKMEKLVLVRGWKKGASWSFPRGKINKDEKDLDCAIREVYEETGYDLHHSGLVPENEDDVKYIDITMREQHMRLFVFRGVPEDTYFEPKTRKEISKIQWYAIKDLPGFKKHKPGHAGTEAAEHAHANKFYMVAPFLGPLKKWINHQRKKDTLAAPDTATGNGYVGQTGTEDEGGMESEYMPEHGVALDEQSEELKKLLSVGGGPAPIHQPTKPVGHPDNLLAMLQGGSKPNTNVHAPQTPFEQIDNFSPREPQTPQPHQPRNPSIGQHYGPPPPQFPFSPLRMQQEQHRNFTAQPTPNVFGPGPPGFPPNRQPPPGYPSHMQHPPHLQQRQHFQQRLDGRVMSAPNGMPFNGQVPPHMQPPQQMQPQFQQRPNPPHMYMAQGPQGAIASGPEVPNASQLPPPRLNAQAMKLLHAFKGGNQPSSATANAKPPVAVQQPSRPASTHQAALLDLFRKPSASSTSAPLEQSAAQPASPTVTDVTVKPTRPERRPTLNEITRTLPPSRTKVKSTPPPPVESAPTPIPIPPQPEQTPMSTERPKSRQLFDPWKAVDSKKAATPAQTSSPVKVPHPSSNSKRHSPRPSTSQNSAQPTPQFTILTRPGSAKGLKSPNLASPATAVPASPLRPESNTKSPATFQPQVLKRPTKAETETKAGDQKKEQLLSLFGKASGTTPSPSPQPPPAPAPAEKQDAATDQKAALLGLFSKSNNSTSTPTPAPAQQLQPPTPHIEPEQHSHPASTKITPTVPAPQKQQQQNLLLDLFNHRNEAVAESPTSATPISPFTLGTPAMKQPPPIAALGPEQRSASGDARDFLMGYLNGVVKKEGYRGAGK